MLDILQEYSHPWGEAKDKARYEKLVSWRIQFLRHRTFIIILIRHAATAGQVGMQGPEWQIKC